MSKRKILAGENKNRKSANLSMSWHDFDFLGEPIPKKSPGQKFWPYQDQSSQPGADPKASGKKLYSLDMDGERMVFSPVQG